MPPLPPASARPLPHAFLQLGSLQTAADHPELPDWEDGLEVEKEALVRGKAMFDGCCTLAEMRERLRWVAPLLPAPTGCMGCTPPLEGVGQPC